MASPKSKISSATSKRMAKENSLASGEISVHPHLGVYPICLSVVIGSSYNIKIDQVTLSYKYNIYTRLLHNKELTNRCHHIDCSALDELHHQINWFIIYPIQNMSFVCLKFYGL